MTETEAEHLLVQVRKVAEDSLYSAQAHFADAKTAERKKWLFIVAPALFGAFLALVAAGCPDWKWAATAAAFFAAMSGIASAIGVDRDAAAHSSAGQALTVLRHEASRLATGYWREMTQAQLYAEVHRVCDKYDQLCSVLIPTSNDGFAAGQGRVKQGTFDYDFQQPKKAEDTKETKTP